LTTRATDPIFVAMQCPRCPQHPELVDVMLTAKDVTATARKCAHCGGHLFARADFEQISEIPTDQAIDLERIPEPGAQLRPLDCPNCGEGPMLKAQSRRERSITMDLCTSCQGIWLDGGELEAIRGGEVGFAQAAWAWFKGEA
jgi:Zn-finger nucleic acid-binding protein